MRNSLLPPRFLLILISLGGPGAIGCAAGPSPVCAQMCAQAEVRYGSCLDGWGLSWEAAGYEDAADFQDACLTWVWGMGLLEADAGETGVVDSVCEDRSLVFSSGTCDDFTSVNWSTYPGGE